MALRRRFGAHRVLFLVMSCLFGFGALACGTLPFTSAPAASYSFGTGTPLRIAVVNNAPTGWASALEAATSAYGSATPMLDLTASPSDANIVITVRSYSDAAAPSLAGYTFQSGVGGFAAVYDAAGRACNYPPSPLPLNCDGQIARADIYLNDAIPAGSDIEARRQRLLLHELGHALGLTRHSPDLGVGQLEQRYGW